MSEAERVNDCITAVTPQEEAAFRFSLSAAVSGSVSISGPSSVMPLRLPRTPPRSTFALLRSTTSSDSLASSSRSSMPGSSRASTVSGRGTPPAPSLTVSPGASSSGRSSAPVLSSGPCVSMSSSGFRPRMRPASNSASIYFAAPFSPVCERFSRAPVMPASSILPSVSARAQEGPRVP